MQTVTVIAAPPRTAARVAGFMYLFLLVAAGVAEFGLRAGDATERAFRTGVALDLVAAPGNVVLALALYALLRPVNPHLALLALLWRTGEAVTLAGIAPLALDPAPAGAVFDAHEYGYMVGLVFFALGSTVVGYLLLRSGLVPRPLAVLGIAAPLLVLASMYTIIVFPGAERSLLPAAYAPIGLFELTLGVWLLVRPPAAQP